MMKLSIIIPVYNVEKYVEKCLLSCIHQDIPSSDYEIIVVNDGTKDNSLAIVNKIAIQYDNISVFSQENQGLSAARNKGLSLAKGEYIWFVDSDDWIEENCLGEIISSLNQNIDCLTFKHNRYTDLSNNDMTSLSFEGIKSGIDLMKMYKVSIPAPYSIFKRNVFFDNNLFFHEGIHYEDSELIPKLYYFAKKCLFLDEVCYYYFQREGSIMSSFSLKKALDILCINENLLNFASETIKGKSNCSIFYYWIGLNINVLASRINQLSKEEYQQISSLLIKKRTMFRAMIQSRRLKYKIEGILFLVIPQLALKWCELYFSGKNK